MIFISGIFLLLISFFYKKDEVNVIPALSLALGIILLCSGIVHLFKDLKEWEQRFITQADAEKVQVYKEIKTKGDIYKVQVNIKKNLDCTALENGKFLCEEEK